MIAWVALVVLLGIGGAGLAALCRPRSVSGWVALTLCGAWAWAVLVVEAIGRVRYDETTMLTGAAVAAAIGGVALWSARQGQRPRGRIRARLRRALRPWWLRAMLVVWLALIVYSVVSVWVMPPSVPDVLRYHLPMSVVWMREGRVGVYPELDYRANFFPHSVQLLSGLTILMRGDDRMSALPQVVLSGVLWPLACYLLARVCGLRRYWSAGAAMLASMTAPVVLQMRHEVTDVGHYAAVLIGLAIALDGVRGAARVCDRRWLALGIVGGLALGSKSSGPLVAVALGGAWVLAYWARSRWNPLALMRRAFFARKALVVLLMLAVGGWVFAANTISYGNPVYPMIMQIGPVTLPGPGELSPLRGNKWIYDFSKSPLERLVGGVARWDELMLSLPKGPDPLDPDFRDNRSPTNSGFGWMTTACTIAAAALVPIAAVRLTRRRRLPRRLLVWLLLALVLAAYNAVFLAMVSLITAPQSTVDARYQLHLAFVVALLAAGALPVAFGKRPAAVVMWASIILSANVGRQLIGYGTERHPHRGWRIMTRMIEYDHPRHWVWTGRPSYTASDMDAFYASLEGVDTVLLLGRGKVYPVMGEDFKRRVIPVGGNGPDYRVDAIMGADRGNTDAIMTFYLERWSLSQGVEDPDVVVTDEMLNAHRRRYTLPVIARMARVYYRDVAVANDATHLVSTAGRFFSVDGNGVNVGPDPHWEIVLEQSHPNGRLSVVVYRLVEPEDPDDFGERIQDGADP